jgi:hypothetical protein
MSKRRGRERHKLTLFKLGSSVCQQPTFQPRKATSLSRSRPSTEIPERETSTMLEQLQSQSSSSYPGRRAGPVPSQTCAGSWMFQLNGTRKESSAANWSRRGVGGDVESVNCWLWKGEDDYKILARRSLLKPPSIDEATRRLRWAKGQGTRETIR